MPNESSNVMHKVTSDNNKATHLESSYSHNIGGMCTLKYDIIDSKLYDILLKH